MDMQIYLYLEEFCMNKFIHVRLSCAQYKQQINEKGTHSNTNVKKYIIVV